MSAESLRRIMDRTEKRLRSAAAPEQFRAIQHDHLAALAGDLAETLFLHVKADPRFTDPEINELIVSNLFELTESVSGTFRKNGITDRGLEGESRAVAGDAFLNRLEHLFKAFEHGGAA